MSDSEKIKMLQSVIRKMLSPIKDVPLDVIISSFTGKEVIKIDFENEKDIRLIDKVKESAKFVFNDLKNNPIEKNRPNEVGNAIEAYIRRALEEVSLRVETPSGASKRKKATGYPDLLVYDEFERPSYIECKTFNRNNIDTTLRAFYLSPSDDFKASLDARHLLFAFEMKRIENKNDLGVYVAESAKLLSLESLTFDVKFEFQSDNRRMYRDSIKLFELYDQ